MLVKPIKFPNYFRSDLNGEGEAEKAHSAPTPIFTSHYNHKCKNLTIECNV
jgi:hypothetical protein